MSEKPATTSRVKNPCRHTGEFAAGSFWRAFPERMRRRWWLFRAFDLMARHWPVGRARKGLLVVRMDGIGDMVLFAKALDHYAEAFGIDAGDITVLGCDSWGPVADAVFAGSRVITLNEHAFAKNPFYRFKISLMVRRLNAAAAVNDAYFRRALMADSLVWLSGAPRTVSSRPYVSEKTRPEYTWYLSQISEIIDTGPYPSHEILRHFEFVSKVAGREIPPQAPQIDWREGPESLVPEGEPYIVLNPGSNEPGRRWPFAAFTQIAARALDGMMRVVLVGSRSQKPDDEELSKLTARPGVIDLFGKTDLPQLMDVMKGAACVLSNDTGPAHLSIAMGAPTVVVVGGGHYGCFVPYPKAVCPANARFVSEPMECYHCFWRCHKRADSQASFPCIADISVDAVWTEMRGLLRIRNEKSEAG